MQSRAPNRLSKETSPYLLQHAHNPVDWHPWGPEALARAKAEDKPILLSVGYSSCHWCHVMERESFEDEATAALMNERFINVKVDREERPDLDQIYQLVVQLMGRSGGWPLTVFLTPDQRPFFGGTYFPPVPKYGMPSFSQVLTALSEAYGERRGEVDAQAGELSAAIAEVGKRHARARGEVTTDALGRAADKLARRFDETHGGFGARPKFPNTMALEVLLTHALTSGDARSMSRFARALDGMQAGGIHDHLGGGFHRYSTDERWLVPHFEKMLYDNALLLRLYADGHRALGDAAYGRTARAIVSWLDREMTRADGVFFSAQDADSEGEEGRFFVWTPAELTLALGADDARIAAAAYDVTARGNFAEPGHEPAGASVLSRSRPPEVVASELGLSVAELESALEPIRRRLFEARERRPRPFRDEKVMVSLNALMIHALADAGPALGEPAWVEKARAAFERVWKLAVTTTPDVRLARYLSGERAVGSGFLEDYANLARASLALYEATGEPDYVARARQLVATLEARFRDGDGGGFFGSPDDGESLLLRAKDTFDHAAPSGLATALAVYARLGAMADAQLLTIAEHELAGLAGLAEDPFGHAATVLVLDWVARGPTEVVLIGNDLEALVDAVARQPVVHRLLVQVDPSSPSSAAAAPDLLEGKASNGRAVGYVCHSHACSRPLATAPELVGYLRDLRKSLK